MNKEQLKTALSHAISAALAGQISPPEISELLVQPKKRELGEIAFPCFQLSKLWGISPPQCSAKLKSQITLPAGFAEVTDTGPFLNFRFERAPFSKTVLGSILNDPLSFAKADNSNQKIIVEYSSPNIAKPFHVGHLRATLIGNALDRVYRHRGYTVVSINHLGDWGTQFGFVYAGCKLWGRPAEPTVAALVDLYRRATSLKEAQEKSTVSGEDLKLPDINEIARAYFVDLESGVPEAVEFWQWCLDISMKYFYRTYDRLNVAFDHYTGESFYSDKLEGVRADLERAGVLKESQGAIGVDLGEELGFARIYTPDGRSLYLTRDLATAKYRAETFHFNRAVYVVGAPQTLHFRQIIGVLRAIGFSAAEGIVHVPFGMVLGMKTRGDGEFVELNDFLDEAHSRALDAYNTQVSKRPAGLDENAVAEAVSLGAIVFTTLIRTRMKDVQFSWDSALSFQGDSGPYLLYALARINGVKERATQAGVNLTTDSKFELLVEDEAFALIQLLESFPELLDRVIRDHEPAHLASYALELAFTFSKAYQALKVLGVDRELAEARLALFEATRIVLTRAIELLGMRSIDRM